MPVDPHSPLMPFEEARTRLAELLRPLTTETVPLADASGRVLAETARSDSPLPRENVSSMDGFAVRAAELDGSPLPLSGEIPAGTTASELPAGTATRIFTGAPLPKGADTVIPREQAELLDERVRLQTLPAGSYVRHRGEVLAEGETLGVPGERLTPWRIALLAAGGAAKVRVFRLPRVAVLLTGSELVDADRIPAPGQVRDSNSPMLNGLLRLAGAEPVSVKLVPDSRPLLGDSLAKALDRADVVLTVGGVSVGDYDYVPDLVNELGGETIFHRLRVKPGKPLLAARFGERWLLGLPGNPLSVLTGWRLFVWPLLTELEGQPGALGEQAFAGELEEPAANPGSRVLFHPATIRHEAGRILLRPQPFLGSHDLKHSMNADAIARIEPGQTLDAGASIPYFQLDRLHEETFAGAARLR